MRRQTHKPAQRRRAFTLVEIMVVVAIIGLVAALAVPMFAKARTTSLTQKCIENQRLVYQAVQRYEMDTTTTLFSIRSDGVAIRNTLLNGGYVNYRDAFECPASSVKDYDDITLQYSGTDFTNTYCTMYPAVHILP